MTSDVVIRVEGLGKRYTLGAAQKNGGYTALRDVLAEKAKSLIQRPFSRLSSRHSQPSENNFWALKDVYFEVRRGEVVGIIGRNGAGKSTLLKILSRITEPTQGSIRLRGRVASLLEVGTGFHPELTGRENIFLNGAILGMHRAEIKAKFDEIVAFAEVERFLDTPVKRYSSGMYVRLAFAVAAHLEPEILIVDEVLAVGDIEFQKKCLGKLHEVATLGGRTVLFVSHNMQAISTLTQHVILLARGQIIQYAPTAQVITSYLRGFSAGVLSYSAKPNKDTPRVTRVKLSTAEPNNVHICGEPFQVHLEITTPRSVRSLCLSLQVLNELQQPVIHLWTFDSERPIGREPGVFEAVCKIPEMRLYMGRYHLKFYLSEPPGGEVFEIVDDVCPFEVVMYKHSREFAWEPGACVYLETCGWSVHKIH